MTNPDTNRVYGISTMCRYFSISRAAYYKWLHHTPSARELENQWLVNYICELEEAHNYIFGVKGLATYINKETTHHVGFNRVRRLMRENNIHASIRIAKHDRQAEQKKIIFDNKLLREHGRHYFKPDHANEIWVTDCTELRYGINLTHRLRLSAIKDLYDHSIIAWTVEATETAHLVTTTLDQALVNEVGHKPQILHSDQGSSYTSGSYNTKLQSQGIVHSMSRPGRPGDNSPMESFWSHMKTEYFTFHQALSETELISQIESWINWYNYGRRQLTLNGMTPKEYRDHAIIDVA